MRTHRTACAGLLAGVALAFLVALVGFPAAAAPIDGSTVYLGSNAQHGHGGTFLVPVYLDAADAGGEPDFWAYCIENQVAQEVDRDGVVGDWASFLGTNYFESDPVAAQKVAWLLINGYPSLTVAELQVAAGIPGLTQTDAVEAMQYAIWRYTDLNFDAAWSFGNADTEALYWHLLAGANAHGGYTEAELDAMAASVSLSASTSPQVAGTLVGPVTVSTSLAAASLTVDPPIPVTDVNGDPVDLSAVTDGQELYLDLRGSTTAGSVEFTAEVESSAGTGMVVSVDAHLGAQRAQSLILVSAAGATTTASATMAWTGVAAPTPVIGTTVAVVGSPAKELPLTGGTVIDTVAYDGLTPGVEYVLSGSIRTAPDGSDTGISASRTFTPTSSTGEIDITFDITAAQARSFAGQDLVVFEYLTAAGSAVAEHADPTDQDQTFSVADDSTSGSTTTTVASTSTTTAQITGTATGGPVQPLPRTGTGPQGMIGFAGVTILSGLALLVLRRLSYRIR